MRVMCLSTRGLDKASTYYRFVQFIEFFRNSGVAVEFLSKETLGREQMSRLADYDVVINQRCLLPLPRAWTFFRSVRRSFLDFDDAIYTRPGRPWSRLTALRVSLRLRYLLTHSDLTTVANGYLAGYARRHAKRVEIVPMALDSAVWHPGSKREKTGPVRIGWIGSPANLPQLERIGPALAPLFKRRTDLRAAIFCGRKPEMPFEFEYRSFRPGAEPEFVRSLDIGLLPLEEDEFTRGKSPIKALQYLASGVPVVGEIFGGAAEMLDETNSVAVKKPEDWPAALEALAGDRELRVRLGQAGLERFRARHELRVVGARWLELLREI